MLPTTLRDGAYVPKRVKEEIDFDGPIERGAKKFRPLRCTAQPGRLPWMRLRRLPLIAR
jgi:hypothetical protein